MMYPPKSIRFAQFIEKLKAERSATTREDAVSLMQQVMNAVEDSHGLSQCDYDRRMHVFSLDVDWKDLDTDPCYWDDAFAAQHRTQVFNNGRIIIRRLKVPGELVLDKPGAHA